MRYIRRYTWEMVMRACVCGYREKQNSDGCGMRQGMYAEREGEGGGEE